MPVMKTHEEVIRVTGGTPLKWFDLCVRSLNKGIFCRIRGDEESFIVDADYRTFFTWGDIHIAVSEDRGEVEIAIRISAATDNLWAAFWEPRQTILQRFRAGMPADLPAPTPPPEQPPE